jgi:predicted nucleic-acid-binding Zn-ribbon protein
MDLFNLFSTKYKTIITGNINLEGLQMYENKFFSICIFVKKMLNIEFNQNIIITIAICKYSESELLIKFTLYL